MEEGLETAVKLGWIDGVTTTYNYRVMGSDRMKAAVDACGKAGIGLTAIKSQARFAFYGSGNDAQDDLAVKLAQRFLCKEGYCSQGINDFMTLAVMASQSLH